MEKQINKEEHSLNSLNEKNTTTINRLWSFIRDTFTRSTEVLPKKKNNPRKDILPRNIVWYKRCIRKLSKMLLNMTEKQIIRNNLHNQTTMDEFTKKYEDIINETTDKLRMQQKTLIGSDVTKVKATVSNISKILQIKYKEEMDKYQENKIKFFIEKRCEDLSNDPTAMIDSILNRERKQIILTN